MCHLISAMAKGPWVDVHVRPVRMKESRYLAPSSPRGLRYTKVLSAANVVQIASKSHDPSMRTVHSPPELTNDRQFRDKEDLTGNWIGGLPVYQAGGPPLDFEKAGWSFRASPRCCWDTGTRTNEVIPKSAAPHQFLDAWLRYERASWRRGPPVPMRPNETWVT